MCNHYNPTRPGEKINCISCTQWAGRKCRDEALLIAERDRVHREGEQLMGHSAYKRDHGVIKQVRQG